MPCNEPETGALVKNCILLSSTQDEQDVIEDSENDDDDGWEVFQAAERRNKRKASSTSMVMLLLLFWSWKGVGKKIAKCSAALEKLFWTEHMQRCRLSQAVEQMATSSPISASSP